MKPEPLRSEHLGQRREAVGKAVVELHLGTLVGLQRTLVRDVVVLLVDIYEARRLVEQRSCSQRLGLHVGEHLRHGGEADDRLAELLALGGILQRLAVGCLAKTRRLCGDTQTCGVHERHDVFDKSHFAVADKKCGGVGKDQLAGGRALDTELVLDAAHLHSPVALVVYEHRQTAGIRRTLLRAGEHERHLAVAVGNEALDAIETP